MNQSIAGWLFDSLAVLIALAAFTLSFYAFRRDSLEREKRQASQFGVSWVRIDFSSTMGGGTKIGMVSEQKLKVYLGRRSEESASEEFLRFEEGMRFSLPYIDPPRYVVGIMMANGSEAPLYDIVIRGSECIMKNGIRLEGEYRDVEIMQPFLPSGDYIAVRIEENLPYKKGDKLKFAYPERLESFDAKIRPIGNQAQDSDEEGWFIREFSFTDAQGRRWTRSAKGELKKNMERRSWLGGCRTHAGV